MRAAVRSVTLSSSIEASGKEHHMITTTMITSAMRDGAATGTSRQPAAATPVVCVVDDDTPARDALAELILACGWHARTFASARAFLASPHAAGPGCLVLDVDLPDLDGLEVQRLVALERPEMAVVFTTRRADVRVTVQAMKAGAVEFLAKPVRQGAFVEAIEHAIARSRRVLAEQSRTLALLESYASLTPREREVMVLVVSGLLNKQVGGELGISEITVKAHRGQVMRKMKAGSLPALVHMVDTLGVALAASSFAAHL
jgi:FixJ family two-component response regulator